MPSNRPFVPIEASERSRLRLKPNLADCSRIRDVWLQRQLDNQNRDSGYSTSVGIGCLRELRAIAEEESQCALGLLDEARKAIEAALPHVVDYRHGILCEHSLGLDPRTLPEHLREKVAAIEGVVDLIKSSTTAVLAANQE